MSSISELLDSIRGMRHCTVLAPCGQPRLPSRLKLPLDLAEFYEQCGGVRLFDVDGWANCIVSPNDLKPADYVFFGQAAPIGPEAAWYAIADVQDGNYLLIDLAPARLGLCYDGFHETYKSPGYMMVVAASFTEMLETLVEQGNNGSYWLDDGFQSLGDAYDRI